MQLPNPHRSAWADEINAFILFTLTKEARFFKENVLFNQKQKILLTGRTCFALTVDHVTHVMARIFVIPYSINYGHSNAQILCANP